MLFLSMTSTAGSSASLRKAQGVRTWNRPIAEPRTACLVWTFTEAENHAAETLPLLGF
jgi:hypothetical protein